MRVIATAVGYMYEQLIRPGTEFSVPDGLKAKWFKPKNEYVPEPIEILGEPEPNTLSQMANIRPPERFKSRNSRPLT